MLTEKEIAFMTYWELVRERHSTFQSKLLRGLPVASFFGLPIILSIAIVYFLSPEWYAKISQNADSAYFTIILAVVISILFFSYIRMHFKWEMNEQLYEELKCKQFKNLSKEN